MKDVHKHYFISVETDNEQIKEGLIILLLLVSSVVGCPVEDKHHVSYSFLFNHYVIIIVVLPLTVIKLLSVITVVVLSTVC